MKYAVSFSFKSKASYELGVSMYHRLSVFNELHEENGRMVGHSFGLASVERHATA